MYVEPRLLQVVYIYIPAPPSTLTARGSGRFIYADLYGQFAVDDLQTPIDRRLKRGVCEKKKTPTILQSD